MAKPLLIMCVISDIARDGLTEVQTILVVVDSRIMPPVLMGVTTKLMGVPGMSYYFGKKT